ncbi:excinuclease ABC, B subunit [Candidatus Stoquefichus sp. KLE1796]|nr:excinuclease ABC, B subunit [Candidatus Stoquefichus sp. KLE1796]
MVEMEKFKLVSEYSPMGDQPTAIQQLVDGIKAGKKEQVLLGGTGTGKTFTVSNVIAQVNKPTLVLAHNKTLAGQLYSELKEFFPENRVEYFVSNFDFYQPEAYIPKSDTYIDKNAQTNYEIEMLRSAAMNSLLERNDTIVVASVASIYGLGNPEQYKEMIFSLRVGQEIDRKELLTYLVDRQYQRNDIEQSKGTFRVRGDVIEIVPGHTESWLIRIELFGDEVERISEVDPLTGKVLGSYHTYTIYPAYGYVTKREQMLKACETISAELKDRLKYFEDNMKPLEYERLDQRTRHDVEMLREVGMCPGIENYSRHIDGRQAGQRPYTLIDYFPKDFLMIVDESHVMLPQVRGMFNGDRSRKETLVEYGFRLPSALDNRPLRFEEFEKIINQVIYVSATPGDYELEKTHGEYAEQIIRPTGLLDPIIEVRPTKNQIDDIISEINERIEKNERVLITTLTKRMAEDLSAYLKEVGLKVAYLHSDTKTLERTEILRDLRLGKYDVLVGINLLREGLDLPEVSLVCILDADKEGFLRSERSLIQTIGRAARNANGKVIMYGDRITDSMRKALDETARRREIQEAYNQEHHITPQTIHKEIRDLIQGKETVDEATALVQKGKKADKKAKKKLIEDLEKEMKQAAKVLDFERAMELRDIIMELKGEK